MLRFDVKKLTWDVHPAQLRVPREWHDAARVGNCVYIAGGFAKGAWTATVERLDMAQPNAEWTPCASMSTARNFFSAVSVQSFLYALGGWNQADDHLNTVERYDATTDAWMACAAMRRPLTSHAAVVLKDLIYVLGGLTLHFLQSTLVAGVDRYDPAVDTWTVCAPMGTPRCGVAAAAIGDKIGRAHV